MVNKTFSMKIHPKIHRKMIYKLKKGIVDIFSEVTEKNYKDIFTVNELLVVKFSHKGESP